MKIRKCLTAILLVTFFGVSSISGGSASAGIVGGTTQQKDKGTSGYSLEFNPTNYELKTLTVDNKTITYRAYENIVYVKYPVDINYEIMNIYVPEEYYEGKSIGIYNSETAPIFLPNTVGGYMPGEAGSPGEDNRSGGANAAFVALSKGYVVAEPGVRGRITQDENGIYTGKAPACIVDLKAAVRYLHYNDKNMPGDAKKIISNGTSAGGALSALLGATGNNKDYEQYLKKIGAADARDDIFAASCYCPITNLEHADKAYEWLFNGINEYHKMIFPGGAMPSPGKGNPFANHDRKPMGPPKLTEIKDTMTNEQIKLSDELKPLFPAYLNSLGLTKKDGTAITLEVGGTGIFKEYVKSFVIVSAQQALNVGTDLSALPWITIQEGIVTDIDFEQYIVYATRMKTTPAFDGVSLESGENDLFGTAMIKAQHFTKFSKEHSTVGGSIADATIVKMMNPMNYIGTKDTNTAQYWRIRHGAIDRDTSLAIPVILATTLENKGFTVDFAVPWGRGHAGDYDLEELFVWMDSICILR